MNKAVIFDTEYTAWEGSHARNWSGPGEHREIVQIGAICIDPLRLREIAPPFSILVKPRINGTLSDYFTKLTGITNQELAERGIDFREAAIRFRQYCGGYPAWCYGRDHDVLNENTALYGLKSEIPEFKGRNLKSWLAQNGGDLAARAQAKNLELCSGNMARILGADFNEAAHGGLNDSRSLHTAIRHLVTKEKCPNPFRR